MSTIKTVAIAGASGNLGPAILNALLSAGTFEVTVLTRESSKATFPSGAKVVQVDYDSLESLTNAFRGQDAVVSTLASLALSAQTLMVDAAIAAGVKRFIPSEFGSDTYQPKSRTFPVYGDKVALQDYLEQKSKSTTLTYTPIITGPFFDWGLKVGFVLNFKENKANLYDGGDRPFSTTRLSTIGQTVVAVLKQPEETKNRAIYVHEAVVTQNQLLKIAKAANPEKEWDTQAASTEKLEKEAYENLKGPAEKRQPMIMFNFLFRAIFGEGYGGEFKKVDNELLGIKMMSEADIKALVESLVEK